MLEQLTKNVIQKKDYTVQDTGDYFHILFRSQTVFSFKEVDGTFKVTQAPPNSLSNEFYTEEGLTKSVTEYLTSSGQGKKYDGDKLRYDLLPADIMLMLFDEVNDPKVHIPYYVYEGNWLKVLYFTLAYYQSEMKQTTEEALEALCEIITYGANKYEANNWQQVESHRYVAAYMRHYIAYTKGEAKDEESGFHHLAHAMCNAMFLVWKDKHEQ